MRIPSLLCTLSIAAFETDDACVLVGFRFGKTKSKCNMGTCERLRMIQNQSRIYREELSPPSSLPVTCEKAFEYRSEYLSQLDTHGLTSIPDLLSSLGDQIVPAGKRLIYMGKRLPEETLLAMKQVDSSLLNLLKDSANWEGTR
jgi:hypothetical protein